MKCIYCSGDTHVTNSRLQKRSNSVWRRRKCLNCQAVFTTSESVTIEQALRVKIGARLVPFQRDHLLLSIYDSLRHRPTAIGDAGGLTTTAMSKIMSVAQHGTVTRDDIVRETGKILRRFDKAAATHYAAFHKL